MSNIVTSGQPLDPDRIAAAAQHQLADGRPTHKKYEDEIGKAQPQFFQDERVQKDAIEFAKTHYPKAKLSPAEMAIARFEDNRANSKAYRWDGQARWQGRENEEMRLVRIMHPYTVLRKLRAAGIDAREDESPHARIWLNSFTRMGRVGINAWVGTEDGAGRKIAKTLTTLQYPYGPEWSIMRFNEYDVPVNERFRGWRTAMLVLITSGVLSEAEVNRAFGEPFGEASLFYRMQLQAHRTINYGLAKF